MKIDVCRKCWVAVALMLALFAAAHDAVAQTLVRANRQQSFDKNIPPGNYSGIAHISGNRYAVVSDKSATDGFYVFDISIDSISGEIVDVRNEGFFGGALQNRDAEGVAFVPSRQTVMVMGEADSKVLEYDMKGQLTGRSLNLEPGVGNSGYESLTLDSADSLLWTSSEGALARDAALADSLWHAPVLRLQCFNAALQPVGQYAYGMDAPRTRQKGKYYAFGVSELLALPGGTLLVLEREFNVPNSKLGASVSCKLYAVTPKPEERIAPGRSLDAAVGVLPKRLVYSWATRLGLFDFSLANYEGMCLGPRLADGNWSIVLVADSQNRAGGVLRDWFKTIVVKNGE